MEQVLMLSRPVVSEEQHPLRRLQARRNLEEWEGTGCRRYVVLHCVFAFW